jgi:SanA protein
MRKKSSSLNKNTISVKRKFLYACILIIAVILLTILACDQMIVYNAKGKLYSNVDSIPFNKVGLLLGTSKYAAGNRDNPFYDYRIDAAAKLLHSGKIKYLVISGDNGRKEYNEPESMRSDLIKHGVDSSVIYLDYAGFRTFDSIVRLKVIFGQDAVTIISQPFHNERAIYIASREGVNAIGFNANNVSRRVGFVTAVREKIARVKVFVDFLFNTKPKFLGSSIVIPS